MTPEITIGAASLMGSLIVATAAVRWAVRPMPVRGRHRRVSRRIPKHPDHTPRPAIRTAVLDPEPGMNLAWRDECERIWDLPEVQSGLDRLRAAIRDEQNGDQA